MIRKCGEEGQRRREVVGASDDNLDVCFVPKNGLVWNKGRVPEALLVKSRSLYARAPPRSPSIFGASSRQAESFLFRARVKGVLKKLGKSFSW